MECYHISPYTLFVCKRRRFTQSDSDAKLQHGI